MSQIPTPGRIVQYCLSEEDAKAVNRRREDAINYRQNPYNPERVAVKPTGFQIHTGNQAHAGDVFPMLIVKAWGSTPESSVNGQVFLDGNDTLWVTSVAVADKNAESQPRRFTWPVTSAPRASSYGALGQPSSTFPG